MVTRETEEITDIFSSGWSHLFQVPEINNADHGEKASVKFPTLKGSIELQVANVGAENTKLFAHHIWKASILLGKHLLESIDGFQILKDKRVLEFGAGAGIPSIIAAKMDAKVVASDYPDINLIKNLEHNLKVNGRYIHEPIVKSHIWGEQDDDFFKSCTKFDIILLADTLWMAHQHENLLDDLKKLLAHDGRIFGVAGLHTGFKTFDQFFNLASSEKYNFKWTRKLYKIPIGNGFCEDVEWELDDEGHIIDLPGERLRWLFKYEMFFKS